MRELSSSEVVAVSGGPGPAVAVIVAAGVLGAAAIGVVAYAAFKGCDASATVGEDGVKVEVSCKPEKAKE